jgi:hypothetical protein
MEMTAAPLEEQDASKFLLPTLQNCTVPFILVLFCFKTA